MVAGLWTHDDNNNHWKTSVQLCIYSIGIQNQQQVISFFFRCILLVLVFGFRLTLVTQNKCQTCVYTSLE